MWRGSHSRPKEDHGKKPETGPGILLGLEGGGQLWRGMAEEVGLGTEVMFPIEVTQ